MNEFIWHQDNVLSEEFCQQVIDKFESLPHHHRHREGIVADGVRRHIKQSYDHLINNNNDEWKDIDKVFFDKLSYGLQTYSEYLKGINPKLSYIVGNKARDTGYQIQKTMPGGFYHWHHDFCVRTEGPRILTYIWYLNTITEGGYTEFVDGTSIQPKQGKMVIFPATWTCLHRGVPPIFEEKYIVTGWMYIKG